MQVKTFMGYGCAGIGDVEIEVNQWLSEQAEKIDVLTVATSMCTVGTTTDLHQCFVITVVYRAVRVRPAGYMERA